MREEDGGVDSRAHLFESRAVERVDYRGEDVPWLHVLSHVSRALQYSGVVSLNIDEVALVDDDRLVGEGVAGRVDSANGVQEAHDGVLC